MKIKVNVDLKVGRVVRYFIFADLALLAGWGLIEPVFSIFIVEQIKGATLVTVGISSAIYWLLKSFLQLPVANYLDKRPGEEDDFRALIIALFVVAFSAFSFSLVSAPWQLYLAQVIHAVGFALYIPSWSAIFSRHLDRDRVSFDWSLDSTAVGLAAGVSAFMSGILANWFGFTAIFILASLLSMLSAFILLGAPELVLPKKTAVEPVIKDHTPTRLGR